MNLVSFTPIGVLHTPFTDKQSAPRQPAAARGAEGTLELFAGRDFEHALSDIEGWDFLWVLFVFHDAEGWRPKVLPPRSGRRRGVFATRSPHRPNPIGLSCVELTAVSGLVLHLRGVDMLDGTPVLDVKPYVPYTDAHPAARTGWLEAPRDPDAGYVVSFDALARAQLDWLKEEHGVDLEDAILRVLSLGPQPHPYRRIRKDGDGFVLALKEWRARFRIDGRAVEVLRVASGYRPSELAKVGGDPVLDLHRAFVSRFPGS